MLKPLYSYVHQFVLCGVFAGDKEVELSNYALPPKENGLCWWFERCSSKSVNSKPGRRFCTFHHNIFNRLEAEVVKVGACADAARSSI